MNTKSILSISLIAVLLMGVIYFDDSFAAKGEPNGQPFQELQTQIDDLNQRVDDAEPDPRVDSFFDVFFDVFTVDSFFDIFTELQTTNDLQQSQIDSFFDVFTEIDAKMDALFLKGDLGRYFQQYRELLVSHGIIPIHR